MPEPWTAEEERVVRERWEDADSTEYPPIVRHLKRAFATLDSVRAPLTDQFLKERIASALTPDDWHLSTEGDRLRAMEQAERVMRYIEPLSGSMRAALERQREQLQATYDANTDARNDAASLQAVFAEREKKWQAQDAERYGEIRFLNEQITELRAALNTARDAESKVTNDLIRVGAVTHGFQPAGSPPPGDIPMLVQWVMESLRDRALQVETALEATQEELKEWNALLDLTRQREQPWIERWQRETGKLNTLPDYGEMLTWLVAKAAEAQRQREEAEAQFHRAVSDDGKVVRALETRLAATEAQLTRQTEARARELEDRCAKSHVANCDCHVSRGSMDDFKAFDDPRCVKWRAALAGVPPVPRGETPAVDIHARPGHTSDDCDRREPKDE